MDVLLVLSVPLAFVLWGRWYYSLRLGPTLRVPRQGRRALALVPIICIVFLYAVLKRFSAESVKSNSAIVLLYLMFGASWVGLTQLVFGLLGVSARDDVLERGNAAAAWVISGQLIGATLCFAGANAGNGPGLEVVIFSAFLSTFALLLLWFLGDWAASLADIITIDRHRDAGIRLCGWLAATGIVLGDAVTGNWKSAQATMRDFAACAWPAATFALLITFQERRLRTAGPEHRWNSERGSMIIAVLYVVCSIGYAWKRGIH